MKNRALNVHLLEFSRRSDVKKERILLMFRHVAR
jgi:hypothetical protein